MVDLVKGQSPWEDPTYPIESEDQARNWVLELVELVKVARANCDVRFPNDEVRTARHQKKAYTQFMIRHGSALGTIMALHRCRKISDVAYNELQQQVLNTLVATVVAKVGG